MVTRRVGNSASHTSKVVLDNTGPAITGIAPGHRALVRGKTIRTTVYANDGSGIRDAYLHGAYSVSKGPYTINASAGPDGLRTLTWAVTDRLGNTSRMSRTVVVDNTRPTLKLTKAPKNGAKVRGTVKITASSCSSTARSSPKTSRPDTPSRSTPRSTARR
ncbi:hypothetical protein CLV67_11934 [Actinoplanes italicus]|uniref:Ig-like protein group 3 n=1 Tax=Actinoplanes italicus TaxID=113567 RepID=A0A2T0K0Y4_9ACTN|nr:hypothetical protein CLV67_11934 [Actinoplanes italicus]